MIEAHGEGLYTIDVSQHPVELMRPETSARLVEEVNLACIQAFILWILCMSESNAPVSKTLSTIL